MYSFTNVQFLHSVLLFSYDLLTLCFIHVEQTFCRFYQSVPGTKILRVHSSSLLNLVTAASGELLSVA